MTQVVPWSSMPADSRGYRSTVLVTDLDNRSAELLVAAVSRPGDPETPIFVKNSSGLRLPSSENGYLPYNANGRPGTWRLPN
jgi:hypothetical protein